jgi:NADH-quinone oxidoreductase subunit A
MTDLVAHLLLFSAIGVVFLMLPLIAGWFVRPRNPSEEKLAAYECGEPTIGSAYIQFDLRFYVVALLFIIFDVEVAFFFPWATVFGGATTLLDPRTSEAARTQLSEKLLNYAPGTIPVENVIDPATAERIAWLGLSDILVFFAIRLVAVAYVWKRGDLDWVRAVTRARVSGATRRDSTGTATSAPRPLETVA